MNISLDLPGVTYFVKRYEPGIVWLSTHETFTSSILLTPESCTLWPVQVFEDLTPDALKQLLNLESDVILLGTGLQQKFLPPTLLQLLTHHQKTIEVMNSKAACRTYNLLASEGRQAVLGLVV